MKENKEHKLLEKFIVIDQLKIGPVKLEKARLVCPYTVKIKKKEESTDLIFKYEEEVFDPDSSTDFNMASMMAAQVALNFIVFQGLVKVGFHDSITPI